MDQMGTATVERRIKKRVPDSVRADWWPTLNPWQAEAIQHANGDEPHVYTDQQSNVDLDEQKDPYRYGWRYIQKTMADGEVKWDIEPLTLEGLLHPEEDDFIMNKPPHGKNTGYLSTVLGTRYENVSNAFVSDDLRMDLDIPGVKPLGPDVTVLFDVKEEKAWGTFYTQEEGTKPTVAFEVTSPSTRRQDFNEKYDYYIRAGIPFYVILDIEYDNDNQVRDYILYAYELMNGNYVAIESDNEGRYWLPPLDIFVGVGEEGILCYDQQGDVLMNHSQAMKALAEQERIALQEAERATEQERIAQQEAERATEQERIAQQEAERATEQERIAQQEAERAAEQERIAQQEAKRATEQERIAQQEIERAAEQERIAQQEAKRAAEQERIARQAILAQQVAEEENERLRALVAQLGGKL